MEASMGSLRQFDHVDFKERTSGGLNITNILNSLDSNNDGLIQATEVDESLGEGNV